MKVINFKNWSFLDKIKLLNNIEMVHGDDINY